MKSPQVEKMAIDIEKTGPSKFLDFKIVSKNAHVKNGL